MDGKDNGLFEDFVYSASWDYDHITRCYEIPREEINSYSMN